MSILHWNIRGFRSHRQDLRHLISSYAPKVLCLQETFLTSPPFPIPHYRFFSSPHSISSSAILLHHSVACSSLPAPPALPCTVLRVFLRRWISLVSLYLPPSRPIDFDALHSLLSGLPPPLLVVGDFNCRHTLWGDSIVTSRGRSLERFLQTFDLALLNAGSPTHFDLRTQSFSCLDLAFCSPSLLLDLHWSVLDHNPCSDHFPILLSPTSYVPLPNSPRWCFDRADWRTFSSLSTPLLSPTEFSSSYDMLASFIVVLLSAAFVSIPRTTRSFSSKCVPWWNLACTKALRLKRAAWSGYRCRRDTPGQLVAFVNFKRASAQFRRTVRSAQTSSWRSYISTLTSSTPIASVWRRVHKLSGKHPPTPSPALHTPHEVLAEPLQVATELGSFFSQVSDTSQLSPRFTALKAARERTPVVFPLSSAECYNVPFSSSELDSALQSCRNTCEGPDGIHYQMLRHLSPPSQSFLLALFNRVWVTGDFPPQWREALILPFLKPNKPGTQPQHFRPIALTSCVCKLLERMINYRLMWYLESKSLLSSSQFGFRRARSTADPLARLHTCVTSAFARRESVLAVFFDLEKAYDTSWRYHILHQVSCAGITGNMGVFLHNFLQGRTFRVKVASSCSPYFRQHEGVPQGSVLSTTLFLLAINGMVSVLPSGVRSSLYVDDFAIYASGVPSPSFFALLQSAVSAVSSWATDHGFRFSVAKSFSIFFSRSRTARPPPLLLYDSPIAYQLSGKFLGLTFDSRLTWKPHILSLKNAALRRLCLLQSLSRLSWGADRKTLLHLHTVLILSLLDYGCHVYSSASPSLLSLLDPVHHKGLRLALGAFRSSPAESLYAESGIPSLSRRRALLSLRFYARSLRFPSPALRVPSSLSTVFLSRPHLPSPLLYRMQSLLSHSPFPAFRPLPFCVPSTPPWLTPPLLVCSSVFPDLPKSDTPPSLLRSCFLDHFPLHSDSVCVFTDGSKTPVGSGFAVLFPGSRLRCRLPAESSVLTTELYAILYALQRLSHFSAVSFTIFTDSRSALSALSSLSSPHPLVTKIQDWLFRFSGRRKTVRFCWVPSHVGVPGNSAVDSLARSATTLPSPYIPVIPAHDYYPAFKSFLYSRWQSSWSSFTSNRLRAVKPSVSPWACPYHPIRRWETALARLRIGHTRLTHSYLMSRSPPPLCPSCHSPSSLSHFLLHCPAFANARTVAFPHLSSLPRAPSLADLLSESPTFSLPALISFLRDVRVLHLI